MIPEKKPAKLGQACIRYVGAKTSIAKWIIGKFPPHDIFVDVFGGSGCIILNKPRSDIEIYNDIYKNIITFFSVLRSTRQRKKLAQMIWYTPFSRDVLLDAVSHLYKKNSMLSDLRRAYYFFLCSWLSFRGLSATMNKCNSFQSTKCKSVKTILAYRKIPDYLDVIADRFRYVYIENRDYKQILKIYDTKKTLFYFDPPYVMDARFYNKKDLYQNEFMDQEHIEFLQHIKSLHGMCIVSGYDNPLYEKELSNWIKFTKEKYDLRKNLHHEVIWLNKSAQKNLNQNPLLNL